MLVDWVQWVLRWLDSWPAGLKLNTELSRFYSLTFIGLISIWGGEIRTFRFLSNLRLTMILIADILQRGAPYMPTIIYVVGTLSCGGMTVAISLLMDMLALLTLHLYLCYVLARAVYQRMLRTAWSLFNLFRGKFVTLNNWTSPTSVLRLAHIARRQAIQCFTETNGFLGI